MRTNDLLPQAVGGRAPLYQQLVEHLLSDAADRATIDQIVAMIPLRLLNAECFFDRLTSGWRYEYAEPLEKAGLQLHGAIICPRVQTLGRVLRACLKHLPESQRRQYLSRLATPVAHMAALAEFLPVVRLRAGVAATKDYPTGVGARDADWLLQAPDAKPILIDVKYRVLDIIDLTQQSREPETSAQEPLSPRHDPALLLRSIEGKFLPTLPTARLQGAWIQSALAQPSASFRDAFDNLDPTRVHFVILGDWTPGVYILSRTPDDRAFLLDLFGERQDETWLAV